MPTLSRRVAALEARSSAVANRPDPDPRQNWPRRFAAYSPANAEVLDRIRRFFEVHAPACVGDRWPDAWLIPSVLTGLAGWGHTGVSFPENPTPLEAEARALVQEFFAAASAYQDETGDPYPMPTTRAG